VIVDGHVARTHHLETVTPNHDRRVLVDPDAEQLGVRLHDLDQVELPVAAEQVLIDGDVPEERHALHVVTHHDRVRPGVAPRQVGSLNGGAGRRPADHAAPREQRPQLLAPGCRVDVAATANPGGYRARLAQLDEGVGIGLTGREVWA
jgi:hypothetical protein